MLTLDLRNDLKYLYAPSAKKVELVDVPEFQFAMIDGAIEPGHGPGDSAAFGQALEALYGISYTLKFSSKKREQDPIDYRVMALEALWWTASGVWDPAAFEAGVKDDWRWTAMIMQPDHIMPEMFEDARGQLRKKRGDNAASLTAIGLLRLERFHEGPSIQVMHVGPYADEPATIKRMDAFALANNLRLVGRHHEIYLGDPRRAAPEKLKTVLRHPVEKVAVPQM